MRRPGAGARRDSGQLGGRRAHGAGREAVASGWRDHSDINWLITSARLGGPDQQLGRVVLVLCEPISIWWAGLGSLQVDLGGGIIRLDAVSDWRAQLRGPGVAPVAVAGVAACHGLAALADHPGLASLLAP